MRLHPSFIRRPTGRLVMSSSLKVVPGRGLVTGRGEEQKEDEEQFVVATPLAFAPKANSPLLPLSLKGTTSLLTPKWAHLSPCFGAALTTNPFIGNLLRIKKSSCGALSSRPPNNIVSNTAILADQLFFQMIREAPIFVTRTKSMPASYLTPSMIGGILGHHYHHHHDGNDSTKKKMKKNNNSIIAQYLKERYGIKSNKINDTQWTGISLTRWMDLFFQSPSGSRPSNGVSTSTTSSIHWMPLAVWLVALWETSSSSGSSDSKLCWLDYLRECDRQIQATCSESIFRQDAYTQAIVNGRDPNAATATLEQWKSDQFCLEEELTNASVQASMETLIEYYEGNSTNLIHQNTTSATTTTTSTIMMDNVDQWQDICQATEVVCASIALSQIPSTGCLRPAVPNGYYSYDGGVLTADCVEVTVREIMDLLLWDEESGRFDLSRLPPNCSPELVAFYHKLSKQITTEDSKNADHNDVGKEWFDLLSDLPGCDYFEVGPDNGKPYELVPTMESVAKVCQHLLMMETSEKTWTSLHDLPKAWNESPPLLHVESDTLLHRIPSSQKTARHEVATLQSTRNSAAASIEIRMRCDWSEKSGFCAVTHLRQRRSQFEGAQLQKLKQCLVQKDSPFNRLFALSLASLDVGQVSKLDENDDMEVFTMELLSAAFGCDRRGVVLRNQEHDSHHHQLLQDGFLQEKLQENYRLLRTALYSICDRMKDPNPEKYRELLIWLLHESPVVVESSSVSGTAATAGTNFDRYLELAILSLPTHILADETVQQALWNNNSGLFRGTLLAAYAHFKSGKASLLDIIFGDLKPSDVISLLRLLAASPGKG